MPRSSTQITLHFVWATKRREPILTPQWEAMIYRCIQGECRTLGSTVLALGGMPDHVHLLVTTPGNLAPSQLMQQVKGVSARFANGQMPLTAFLKWQEGYNARSVSLSHTERIRQYVLGQKQHHADGMLHQNWECCGDN